MSAKRKKDPKNQWIFAKKLLKITRVILIVAVIFYLSYALLQKPLSVFGDDFIGADLYHEERLHIAHKTEY